MIALATSGAARACDSPQPVRPESVGTRASKVSSRSALRWFRGMRTISASRETILMSVLVPPDLSTWRGRVGNAAACETRRPPRRRDAEEETKERSTWASGDDASSPDCRERRGGGERGETFFEFSAPLCLCGRKSFPVWWRYA